MVTQVEPVPIDVFVANCFLTPKITSLISPWGVDVAKIQQIVIHDFREMGIFFALPNHYEILQDTIIATLGNSREIADLIAKSEQEQVLKMRNRHADV